METLEDRIKRHEGCRLLPYKDTRGNWTIGIGHKITEEQAQELATGIDQDTADDWYVADIAYFRGELHDKLPWTLYVGRVVIDVLTEMAFQMGVEGLLGFHDMLNSLQMANADAAAKAMLDSDWHKETPVRCEELANLILSAYSQSSKTT